MFPKLNFSKNFLQPNKVVAVSSSNNGKILASADSGPDNIIVIWQSCDLYVFFLKCEEERNNVIFFSSPLTIFFDPYDGNNVLNVALSPSGTLLVSVGEKNEEFLRIDLRVWMGGAEEPDGK